MGRLGLPSSEHQYLADRASDGVDMWEGQLKLALRKGDCKGAMNALVQMAQSEGQLNAHTVGAADPGHAVRFSHRAKAAMKTLVGPCIVPRRK